jgi:glycosyltransferase involved in cell wall biosynthesis
MSKTNPTQKNVTISVIIPALNEEQNILNTISEVLKALGDEFIDHELVLVDDGSTDRTGLIMDEFAAKNARVRVVHNLRPSNFGGAYKSGLAGAQMQYLMMVPGDNQFPADSIAKVLELVGTADIVIPYTSNQQVRPLARRIGSRLFTVTLNLLFGLHIRYYNSIVVHRRELLNTITLTTDSFAYQAEALIKLLRAGHSWVEVGNEITERTGGKSVALRANNLLAVFGALAHLVRQVYFPPKQAARVIEDSGVKQ